MIKKLAVIMIAFFILQISEFKGYELPTVKTENVVITNTSIKFDYTLSDTDLDMIMDTEETYSSISIYEKDKLLHEQEIVNTDKDTFEYTKLTPGTEYSISINAPYDLLGVNENYNEEPYTIKSETFTTEDDLQLGEITSCTGYYNSIKVDYKLNKPDEIKKVQLQLDDTIVDMDIKDTSYLFEELKEDTQYNLKLIIDDQVAEEKTINTSNQRVKPTAHIHSVTEENPSIITDDKIEIHYDLYDYDDTIIYEETAHPRMLLNPDTEDFDITNAYVGENQIATFTPRELLKTTAHLRITAMYDLNKDGIVDNEDPFQIEELYQQTVHSVTTCKDLESIGKGINYPGATHTDEWLMDDKYILSNDIDCSATSVDDPNHDTTLETTYGDDGFDPIGQWNDSNGDNIVDENEINGFDGIFDGNDKQITNLFLNYADQNYIGLFRKVEADGILRNFRVSKAVIVGNEHVGTIAGINKGTLNFIVLSTTINGEKNIGGMVGENASVIENSYVFNNIHSATSAGGVAGKNSGSILTVGTQGTIAGETQIGGITGLMENGVIEDSYSKTKINIVASDYDVIVAGGIAAEITSIDAELDNSYSYGDISNPNETQSIIGGLVGVNVGDINSVYSKVNVLTATPSYKVGGLIGYNKGEVDSSYALGTSSGASLIGTNEGFVSSTFASGESEYGLIFETENGSVDNSYRYENAPCTQGCAPSDTVSAQELGMIQWYIDELNFTDDWNLEKITQGMYPHIKASDKTSDLPDQSDVELPH